MVSRVYLLGRAVVWIHCSIRLKAESTIYDSEPKFQKNHLLSTPNSDFPVLFLRFSDFDWLVKQISTWKHEWAISKFFLN